MGLTGRSHTTLWAFIALSLVWGSSFLFIKISLDGLSPAQVVLGRIVLGGVTLTVIMLVTRRRWPRDLRVWGHLTVVGVLYCVIPFTLYAWAEQYVSSAIGVIAVTGERARTMTLAVTSCADARVTES